MAETVQRKQRRAQSATVSRVLVEYDGPQLVLLETSRRHPMLAVAVDYPSYDYGMFACEIVGNQLDRYLYGKTDLLYVYQTTSANRLFTFDFASADESGKVKLTPATSNDVNNDSLYPEWGIFSRSHTYKVTSAFDAENKTQRFFIDGNWETYEFGKFYSRISDAYAVVNIARRVISKDVADTDKAFLKTLALGKNLDSGGSYRALFSSMRERQTSRNALRVVGIEYHSPGYIDVSGDAWALREISDVMRKVAQRDGAIREAYRSLYGLLQREELLRASGNAQFSDENVARLSDAYSRRLATLTELPNGSEILELLGSNSLIFAKLVLAFARRVQALAAFYAEGRVRSGESDGASRLPNAFL